MLDHRRRTSVAQCGTDPFYYRTLYSVGGVALVFSFNQNFYFKTKFLSSWADVQVPFVFLFFFSIVRPNRGANTPIWLTVSFLLCTISRFFLFSGLLVEQCGGASTYPNVQFESTTTEIRWSSFYLFSRQRCWWSLCFLSGKITGNRIQTLLDLGRTADEQTQTTILLFPFSAQSGRSMISHL